MRTNTIPKHVYETLPHQIAQPVSVKCHDGEYREGKICGMIGYGGANYTMNVRLTDGIIVTTAHPDNVIPL